MKKADNPPEQREAARTPRSPSEAKREAVSTVEVLNDCIRDQLERRGFGNESYPELWSRRDELPFDVSCLVQAGFACGLAYLHILDDEANDAVVYTGWATSLAVVNGARVHESLMAGMQGDRARNKGASKRAIKDWYLKGAEESFSEDLRTKTRPTKRQVSDRAHKKMRDHRALWRRGRAGDGTAAESFVRLSAPGYEDELRGAWVQDIPTRESLYSYYLKRVE